MRWSIRIACGACLASLGMGCGGGGKSDAQSPAVAAGQRLQGKWHLLSFSPSLAMEQPLKGLLDAQIRSLTITFEAAEYTAEGPGVSTAGRYEITSAQGDSLNGRLYDSAGAGYGISGQFIGQQFRFAAADPPWSGTGVLERAP